MRKNLSKIIVFSLIAGTILSGVPSMAQTDNEQRLVLQENASQNVLVLDLKAAKDIKDLPKIKTLAPAKEDKVLKEVKAKIKSLKIKERSPKEMKGFLQTAAIPDPIETGIAWLKNQQQADGSWKQYPGTEIIDSAAIISLLKHTEESTPSLEYQKAIDWFNLTYPENSDYLAEKVISLAEAGQDIGSLAEFLASQINEQDFGFGYKRNYQSDIVITAKVLEAIAASNYVDPGSDSTYTLRSALYYLLLSQNPNGGWPKIRGGQSDIKTTALVLEVLKPYQTYTLSGVPQGDIIIQAKIDLGINYLKNYQNPDGSWQDIEGTAKVYNVLLNYQQEPNYNQEGLNYLTSNQSVNGSFANQDVYITAEALKAIAKPDIAVTDIQNISGTIPNEPTVAKVTITNLGYYKSEPINFKAEPHGFHLIVDGKEVSIDYEPEHPETITFESNSTILLNVTLLNLAFGPHTIEFIVDYDGVEFDKTNNQKSVELIFDDPGFTGPEPPAWVGARADLNPNLDPILYPNQITISWLFSEDPTTSYYYFFLGPSSGNYTHYIEIEGIYNTVSIYGFPHNVPYYFSVVSVDTSNVRGDYSMETSARAYNDPGNYQGTIPFSPKDNNQVLLYNINFYFFGVGSVNSENYNPVFITTYPGHYRATASKTGYQSAIKTIEIKPNETGELVEFILNIIDDGLTPAPIQNLQAQLGNGQITLTWEQFNNSSGDFKNFNIYRSSSEITNVSQLTPIDTSTTDSSIIQFIDNTIVNGVDYYYAVTAEDRAGNEDQNVIDVGPVRGNSAPRILNLTASQDRTGQVQVRYNLEDNEQSSILVEMEYWDGTNWQDALSTTGEGLQDIGEDKALVWNPKIDWPDYDGTTSIKLIADDRESINNIVRTSSADFTIDTAPPANLSAKIIKRENLLVDLELSADGGSSGMAEMRFSNDANLDNIPDNWSEWEPYSTIKRGFVVAEGSGPSDRIIVEFKDGVSNTAQVSTDSCRPECDAGETRCNGDYKQVCGNYDGDVCLEWPSSTEGPGNNNCLTGCENGACKPFTSCIDTDGGRDYYVKGTAMGLNVYSQIITVTDYCTASTSSGPGPYIHEYICNSDGKTLNDMDYLCLNGCENGACKQPTQPSIKVLSPNGGETFVASQTYNITWQPNGVNMVKLAECAEAPLFTCHDLPGIPDSGIAASLGTYSWTVDPNDPFLPGQIKIRIWDANIGPVLVEDYSDNYFNIVPPRTEDTCTDSGDDFYVKDTVTIYKKDGSVYSRSDECMLDGRVQEQMCGDSLNYPGSKNFFSKYLQCPNGCENGACKQ